MTIIRSTSFCSLLVTALLFTSVRKLGDMDEEGEPHIVGQRHQCKLDYLAPDAKGANTAIGKTSEDRFAAFRQRR